MGFSFGQAEAALAQVLGVTDSKRPTFLGRLQQLQRFGLPKGTRVGKGAKADYAHWQIAELLFYFDLLDAGVPPAIIKAHFENTPLLGSANYGSMAESAPKDADLHLGLYFSGLGSLRGENDRHEMCFSSGPIPIAMFFHDRPAIFINLTARIRALKEAIVSVDPEIGELHWPDIIKFQRPRAGKVLPVNVKQA